MSTINYPGFDKIKDPKDLDTVRKPKGDINKQKRVDFVYFDDDAEFDELGIDETEPIETKQFIEVDAVKLKNEILSYVERSVDFAFDEKDFKRVTMHQEHNYVGMYTKLFILQAITTFMTKVYFSIPEPDRGLAAPFKALEKAPTWTTAYIGTVFSDIGRFEQEGIDYNFRNPLSLLYDLGQLFFDIWNLAPAPYVPGQFIQPAQIIAHYGAVDAWNHIGYGIIANDPYPERVFIDALNRLFKDKVFLIDFHDNNIEFTLDLDGSRASFDNFVAGLGATAGNRSMDDDEFEAATDTAGQIAAQLDAFDANEADLGEGPIVDRRADPVLFQSAYSSFTTANDRFFESASSRIHMHRNHTFTGGSRVQLAFSGQDVHHSARGNAIAAYVMETDISNYTPTEIGAATYHSMVYPVYKKHVFEFRYSDRDYVVDGILRKQMERLTVKSIRKK